MRDVLRILGLLIIGIFTAIFVYPFLHEVGHFAAAYMVGAKVVEMKLFPVPYVLCNITMCSTIDIVFMGLGGIVLPFAVTEVTTPRKFWTWYIWLVVKGVSLLAIFVSIVSVISFKAGRPMVNEDITQIFQRCPEYVPECVLLLLLLCVLGIFRVVKSKPIERCLIEFDVK